MIIYRRKIFIIVKLCIVLMFWKCSHSIEINHKVSGIQLLLLWNTIDLMFNQQGIESLLSFCFCANIFFLDQIKNLVIFFGAHNTYPIKAFVKKHLAYVRSSNKDMIHRERKNNISLAVLKVQSTQCISMWRQSKTY